MDDIPKEVPSRQDMRKGMSDIPPIKIDPNQQKGMITDDHAKDLDVNKLVLPEEADIKPKAQPEPKPREATPPPQPAPTPSSPPRPEDSPLPIPRQQSIRQAAPNAQADDQFTGPLFVDIQTYENIQEALSTLKSELKDVTGDLDTITKLNGEEDEQFSKIVKKLEGVQDRILEIDADLFENA